MSLSEETSAAAGGSPPWHECTLYRWPDKHRIETNGGRTCSRYAPLPWAIRPAAEHVSHPLSDTREDETASEAEGG